MPRTSRAECAALQAAAGPSDHFRRHPRSILGFAAGVIAVVCIDTAQAEKLTYPATARDTTVLDDYHGTKVADPYRWLEELESPPTQAWMQAQSRLTHDVLVELPARDSIRRELTALWNYPRTSTPWREANRLFFEENSGLQPQAVLYTLDSPVANANAALDYDAPPRVVLDPQTISADGSIAIRDFAISPDGRWLSYCHSPGGADQGTTRVRALATGRDQPDVVHGHNVCWTSDGGGFFYAGQAQANADVHSTGTPPAEPRTGKVLEYHRLGSLESQDRIIHQWPDGRWLWSMLSDDGRYLIAVLEKGATSRVYTMDLGAPPAAPNLDAPFTPLMADVDASHTPMGTAGNTLYAWTDLEAPRGRIIALDLAAGANARPRTVIPEGVNVLQTAAVAGDRLAVHYIHDVKSVLRIFTLDGKPAGEVALPGIGAIGWPFNGRHLAPELWFSFTSFLVPETVYRYDTRAGTTKAFRSPRVSFDSSAYETRQIFYPSKDGTRVPMFLTAKKSLRQEGDAPTFLTAYGGYGAILNPRFQPEVARWLQKGGVYAVANIRGGGEYGEQWHRSGMLEHKQTSFDDFIAAAEYLVRERYTVPQKLAIYGHSNGGLLIGAVLTQRPDLFGVALANAGHHDMLRYHKFTAGLAWVPEHGSADKAADFGWLRAYSPLHNVRKGTCYPATLLMTGDHDDRVVPSHSYKFVAALQTAQGCDRPVLVRVASNASHTYASEAGEIAEWADVWAFVEAQVGVKSGGQ